MPIFFGDSSWNPSQSEPPPVVSCLRFIPWLAHYISEPVNQVMSFNLAIIWSPHLVYSSLSQPLVVTSMIGWLYPIVPDKSLFLSLFMGYPRIRIEWFYTVLLSHCAATWALISVLSIIILRYLNYIHIISFPRSFLLPYDHSLDHFIPFFLWYSL